jgi:hypothetical protein
MSASLVYDGEQLSPQKISVARAQSGARLDYVNAFQISSSLLEALAEICGVLLLSACCFDQKGVKLDRSP